MPCITWLTSSALGGSLELSKRCLAALFTEANAGKNWEILAVEALFPPSSQPNINNANIFAENRALRMQSAECTCSASPSPMRNGDDHFNYSTSFVHQHPHQRRCRHFALVNFPACEGVLLHQTTVPRRSSEMRVAWRVSEGEELLDADAVDENVLEVSA